MATQNSISGPLQVGSRGTSVATVQAKLNAALSPSPNLKTDGVFGTKTAQAVKSFQQRRGLTADGVVGAQTAAALGLSYSRGGGGSPPMPSPPGRVLPGKDTPAPAFLDLSVFNVVVEAVIAGYQRIVAKILSWIDSDYVPQFVYDRVAASVNGAANNLAVQLRAITRQAVPLGQDPAAFVTGKIRDALARSVSTLTSALQPLVGLPIIGPVASGYQRKLESIKSAVDSALINLRADGQSAQAAATRIAALLRSIADQLN
jgi:hypothetical protein